MSVFAERPEALPLAWWSPAQLEAVRLRVAPLWAQWARDWLVHAALRDATVSVVPAHETGASSKAWFAAGACAAACSWLDGEPLAQVSRLLFDTDEGVARGKSTPVAGAVAQEAWSVLNKSMVEALRLDIAHAGAAPLNDLFKPWSGAVVVRFAAGQHGLDLLLNRDAMSALVSRTQASAAVRDDLASIADAVAQRKLKLKVELDECEFDLGSLAALRVGDVLPLPHALSEPLHLISDDGARLCAAYLGRQAAFKAVELARQHAVAAPSIHQALPKK